MEVKLCETSSIRIGSIKGFTARGRKILVANVNGKFYAMDSVCSHMGGNLLNGKLNGNKLICPRHGAQFNVANGQVIKNVSLPIKVLTRKTASNLRTYKLSIKEGYLFIDI